MGNSSYGRPIPPNNNHVTQRISPNSRTIRDNYNNVRRYNNEISPYENFYHNYRSQHVPRYVENDNIWLQTNSRMAEPNITEQTYINNHNAYVEQLLGITIHRRTPNLQKNTRPPKSHYIPQIEPPTDIQCAICLGEFDVDCAELNCCSHLFHKSCIDDWMKQKGGGCCPLCREKIE